MTYYDSASGEVSSCSTMSDVPMSNGFSVHQLPSDAHHPVMSNGKLRLPSPTAAGMETFSASEALRSTAAVYTDDTIEAPYSYQTTAVERTASGLVATPVVQRLTIRTERHVPKTGAMIVGIGGNNGTTVLGGVLANRHGYSWETKEGVQKANWFGSLTMSSCVKLGVDTETQEDVFVPLRDLLPMVDPSNLVIGGWDIDGTPLGDAMRRAKVIDIALQRQLYEKMQKVKPLPAIYRPDFIASNQKDRANNVIPGTSQQQLETVRQHIREFKAANGLEKVIVIWSASTERYTELVEGVNDTAANLLKAVREGHSEVAPSTIYCVAAILEGCSYINGSPQNTCVPGVLELAEQYGVFLGGDDFKSGQTKFKSVIVDFLVSAGIKPTSIVSYNHLGNNDGKNLSSPPQFRSKEISKSTVVDDMVKSNRLLYAEGEHPDHVIVIKYVPYVGDSKRAMDEYTSEIFLGGTNTIVAHNTCEDSLLAAPIIVDLLVMMELFQRVTIKQENEDDFKQMHSVLSVLSFLCKAPMVPPHTPVVNALFAQRDCIVNILRACLGLAPENHMLLEHKLWNAGHMKTVEK